MSFKAVYERFLTAPNPLSLTESATLHYVPTLKSFAQQGPIIRHLESQNKNDVKLKAARIISTVEGQNALVVEVETILEFISGGGAYLPGLENFVVDKIATLPMTHFVLFDNENKINQIRISWDQGCLLKQTDIIGKSGRNWPINDGKEQVRLISNNSIESTSTSNTASSAPISSQEVRGRTEAQEEVENGSAARGSSPSKKFVKDPHTSLDLFSPHPTQEPNAQAYENVIAPRASARPPPREMSELFAAGHEDLQPSNQNGDSPKKAIHDKVIAPKGAGSKKFLPSRLFDEDEEVQTPKAYKSNPAKYDHFDLGESLENDPLQFKSGGRIEKESAPLVAKTNKHGSQWGFADFYTPQKLAQRVRGQDVVHINWQDNEPQETPAPVKPVPKARPDAESHFELQDDGPATSRPTAAPRPRKDNDTHFDFRDEATPQRRIIARTAAASGLYENNLYDEIDTGNEEENENQPKSPLSTITNNASRKQDFGSHWTMSDDSPANSKPGNENKHVPEDRKKTVQMMEANWEMKDSSPGNVKRPVSSGQERKGMETHWSLGGEGAETPRQPSRGTAQKSFWDF